jgi:hypothetical protein
LQEWDFVSAWANEFHGADLVDIYRKRWGEQIGCVDVEKYGKEWLGMGPSSNLLVPDLEFKGKWWCLIDGVITEADGDEADERKAVVGISGVMSEELKCGDVDEQQEQCTEACLVSVT